MRPTGSITISISWEKKGELLTRDQGGGKKRRIRGGLLIPDGPKKEKKKGGCSAKEEKKGGAARSYAHQFEVIPFIGKGKKKKRKKFALLPAREEERGGGRARSKTNLHESTHYELGEEEGGRRECPRPLQYLRRGEKKEKGGDR